MLGSFRTSTKVLETPTSRPAESNKLQVSSNLLHHFTFTLPSLPVFGRDPTTFSISFRYSAVNTRCLPFSQLSLSGIPNKLLNFDLRLQRLFGQSNLLAASFVSLPANRRSHARHTKVARYKPCIAGDNQMKWWQFSDFPWGIIPIMHSLPSKINIMPCNLPCCRMLSNSS